MTHRILLADPNKTIRLAAQMVFAKSPDIILSTAMNSFEALDKMHLFKPTLAVMDEALAKELCSFLKRLPAPVVILNKPFTSKGLADQVEKALSSLSDQGHQESCSA
jgi:chemotaxis response regulator CheB